MAGNQAESAACCNLIEFGLRLLPVDSGHSLTAQSPQAELHFERKLYSAIFSTYAAPAVRNRKLFSTSQLDDWLQCFHFTIMQYKHSQYHPLPAITRPPKHKSLDITTTSTNTADILPHSTHLPSSQITTVSPHILPHTTPEFTFTLHPYSIHIYYPKNHFRKRVYNICAPERDTLPPLQIRNGRCSFKLAVIDVNRCEVA